MARLPVDSRPELRTAVQPLIAASLEKALPRFTHRVQSGESCWAARGTQNANNAPQRCGTPEHRTLEQEYMCRGATTVRDTNAAGQARLTPMTSCRGASTSAIRLRENHSLQPKVGHLGRLTTRPGAHHPRPRGLRRRLRRAA